MICKNVQFYCWFIMVLDVFQSLCQSLCSPHLVQLVQAVDLDQALATLSSLYR